MRGQNPTPSPKGEAKEDGAEPSPTKTRLEERLKNSEAELEKVKTLRSEALEAYDEKLEDLRARYDAKKDKTTKVAGNLSMSIERVARIRADAEADYTRRIETIEERIRKTKEAIEKAEAKAEAKKFSLNNVKIPSKTELMKKPPVKVVDISTSRTKGTFAERRKQIKKNLGESTEKPHLNKDTGKYIFLTPHSYEHVFSNAGEIQLDVAEHFPELIQNAVLTHKEGTTHGNAYANSIYTFFAAANNGSGTYPVKIKVKEYSFAGQEIPKNIKEYFGDIPQDYSAAYDAVVLMVDEIKTENPPGSAKDVNHTDSFLGPDGSSSIRVSDLLKLVKGNAKFGVFINSNKLNHFNAALRASMLFHIKSI